MKKREIGIAVIGSGRIGSLRAGMASRHPSVNFLALSDKNKTKADILAQKTGADFVTDNNLDAISDDRVDAVVVATPEHDHVEAVLQATDLRISGFGYPMQTWTENQRTACLKFG